jgi:hypothetical protein
MLKRVPNMIRRRWGAKASPMRIAKIVRETIEVLLSHIDFPGSTRRYASAAYVNRKREPRTVVPVEIMVLGSELKTSVNTT